MQKKKSGNLVAPKPAKPAKPSLVGTRGA